VQILLDAGQFKSYLWKPTGETTRTVYSTSAQVYLLSVTDSNNCSTSKQVAVMETCPDFIFIPNAFTPNGDGLNDVFIPSTRNVSSYQMSILNRWGEMIFTTKNVQQGWDGKDAPADVYTVLINYQVDGKEMQSVKQNVSLLR
jgi:gliding motility-associated-like protein